MDDSLSARDQATSNYCKAQQYPKEKPSGAQSCPLELKKLELGVFFDGTDNNMYRDRNRETITNVVRLHDLYTTWSNSDSEKTLLYVEGVGSMDVGKRTRRAALGVLLGLLVPELAVVAVGTYLVDVTGNIAGKIGGLGAHHRLKSAYQWVEGLCRAPLPETEKRIDVYGFSRGAAMARTFVNLVRQGLMPQIANLRVRFVGLFDTVGSFGLPGDESDPGQNCYIDSGDAEQIAHFVARNEIRHNFPLLSINGLDKSYAGAHSDVGGGYAPKDKDKDGKSNHLALIPFVDMHAASCAAGAALSTYAKFVQGVDVEALRAEADKYDPSEMDPASVIADDLQDSFAIKRQEFFKEFVHMSAEESSRFMKETKLDHIFNPMRPEPSRRRNVFLPKRLTLDDPPPGFSWKKG